MRCLASQSLQKGGLDELLTADQSPRRTAHGSHQLVVDGALYGETLSPNLVLWTGTRHAFVLSIKDDEFPV